MSLVIGACIALVVVYLVLSFKAGSAIHKRFGINARTYELLSSDLGESEGRLRMKRHQVSGIADAVFRHKRKPEIVVGEFKSRTYRGEVKLAEFYQVILYIGHLAEMHPDCRVTGVLSYPNKRVTVNQDSKLYADLIGLCDEVLTAERDRRITQPTPLHKRTSVASKNKHLRFTSAL